MYTRKAIPYLQAWSLRIRKVLLRGSKPGLSSRLIILGVILWIAAPLVAVTIVVLENKAAVFASPTDSWVKVEAATGETSVPVDIALKWSAGTQVVAPAWSGTIQSTSVKSDGELDNGSSVVVVDGIRRISWHTPGAFYRPLSKGDSGSDVTWLKALLSARGALLEKNDYFDSRTLDAVRTLARDLKVPEASAVHGFDPTWVIFLPKRHIKVLSVTLVPGAPAPPGGTVIAVGASALSEATVVPPSNTDQDSTTDSISQAQADAAYKQLINVSTITISSSDRLNYAGHEIKLRSSSARITSLGTAVLAELLTSSTQVIPAELKRSSSPGEVTIPAAAVVSTPTPAVCVKVGRAVRVVHVRLVSGSEGATRVVGSFPARSYVRIPGPVGNDPCKYPSSN